MLRHLGRGAPHGRAGQKYRTQARARITLGIREEPAVPATLGHRREWPGGSVGDDRRVRAKFFPTGNDQIRKYNNFLAWLLVHLNAECHAGENDCLKSRRLAISS